MDAQVRFGASAPDHSLCACGRTELADEAGKPGSLRPRLPDAGSVLKAEVPDAGLVDAGLPACAVYRARFSGARVVTQEQACDGDYLCVHFAPDAGGIAELLLRFPSLEQPAPTPCMGGFHWPQNVELCPSDFGAMTDAGWRELCALSVDPRVLRVFQGYWL
ncbi:MAG: hypothetical protein ABTQ32_18390 [Myxococcaceae bacterium]